MDVWANGLGSGPPTIDCMPPTRARRLVTLPVQKLLAVAATASALLAVWYGGQYALTLHGFADLSREEARTMVGVGATAVASSLVPTYLTLREYFGPDIESED